MESVETKTWVVTVRQGEMKMSLRAYREDDAREYVTRFSKEMKKAVVTVEPPLEDV